MNLLGSLDKIPNVRYTIGQPRHTVNGTKGLKKQMAINQSTREDVTWAVARVFRRYGYEGATMTLFCKETGLGRSSLYHYFPGGKEQMASQALDLIDTHFSTLVFSELEGESPAEERLSRLSGQLHEYYEGGRMGCILGVFSLYATPAPVMAHVNSLFERWISALATTYQDAGLPAGIAAKRAARAVAGVQGGLIMAAGMGKQDPLEDALAFMCSLSG